MNGLDPASHVYPAIVWILVIWTLAHAAVGVLMLVYCSARALAGRLTPEHDADLQNTALYWHFVAITVAVTIGVIAGFPLAA